MRYTKQERQEAIESLRKMLKPGDTVHTILRQVSSSGMYRRITLLIVQHNEPVNISWYVARALGRKDCDGSVGTSGCGMDMGFEMVYALAATLWPKGNGKYTTGRNGDKDPETDGGYCLKQRWIWA